MTFDGGYAEYMIAPISARRADAGGLAGRRCGPARCAPGSPRSTPCGTAAPGPATWSPSSASAGSAISAFSTPRRWASTPSASPAGTDKGAARHASSAPPFTSIARPRTRRPNCKSWAGPRSSWRPSPTATRWPRCRAASATNGTLLIVGAAASMQVSPVMLLSGRQFDQGLVFRHVDRRAGYTGLQRTVRREIDERGLPAGPGCRSVRPDDERQGPVSRRVDDR